MKTRLCEICGNPLPRKNGTYCSNTCNGIALRNRRRPDMEGKIPWSAGLTKETSEVIARISESKLKNVVDRDTLYQLYYEQNLTLSQIGQRFGVSKGPIQRLVTEYGLIRKRDELNKTLVEELYSSGKTFTEIGSLYNCSAGYVTYHFGQDIEARNYRNNVGINMDKETIYDMYWNRWMSYEAIAEELKVDFTGIPYWLKKFDIPLRTAWESRRGPDWEAPDPDVLIHLYQSENMGLQTIGELFGTGRRYVENILKENNISLRQSGYPNVSYFTAKDGHRVKSSLELQVDNWLFEHCIEHEYEPYIADTKYKADFKVGDVFIEVWGITGNEKYNLKRQKKEGVYQKHNLSLLSIVRKDFPDLHVLSPLAENAI